MKRKSNTSNQAQKKVSRSSDRAAGRAGIQAANQKAAKVRQHGGIQEHQIDVEHLQINKKPHFTK